jgi:hypothetical protein
MAREILSDERKWALVAAGSAALAAVATRQLLRRSWSAWRGGPPPDNPAAPDVSWGDALLWAGTTGMVVAVGRAVAKRAAVAGWRRVTGRTPPV